MMQNVIEINNVSYQYKGSGTDSLRDVSLRVAAGETVLLCGGSGSGKTSVIRLINGLIPHYYRGTMTGNVRVSGKDIAETELHELAGVVGTVFQNPRSQFFSVDTDGEIVFGPENLGLDPKTIQERKDRIVSEMNLSGLLGRSLFELSGGEKQRIACASVAALLPDIILLDEPSSNLDWESIEKLREIVRHWKSQGKTVLVSEHRLWYLRDIADRVIHMEDGRIAHIWSGEEFRALSGECLRKMKLRPTVMEKRWKELFREGKAQERSLSPEEEGAAIRFRDYYFSYERKCHIFRRKNVGKDDGRLQLCIPELTLPKGKVIAVTGHNGTGKSTFLRCVCGLEKRCGGVILLDGREYRGRKRIGLCYMVMQDVNHQLFTDSVEAEVMLSMKEKDAERCSGILERLGLLPFRDTHPMALSGGQKQRVAIASAIAAGAEILLFDEPTSGLDYEHMEKVAKLLRELADAGSTVLVSTHDPELIEFCCDGLLEIREGRIGAISRM